MFWGVTIQPIPEFVGNIGCSRPKDSLLACLSSNTTAHTVFSSLSLPPCLQSRALSSLLAVAPLGQTVSRGLRAGTCRALDGGGQQGRGSLCPGAVELAKERCWPVCGPSFITHTHTRELTWACAGIQELPGGS